MKQAIVTGMTKGIGLSIAEMLLKEGYYVHGTYAHDDVAAAKAKTYLSTIGDAFNIIKVNQSSLSEIHQFALNIQEPIQCMICNAGTTIRKPFAEITDDDWYNIMAVGLFSHICLIRDLWDQIEKNSRIIFIGSVLGELPHSVSVPYGVVKGAIHALVKNLVKEFEGTGTTINAVAPGFVDTEWQKGKSKSIRDSINNKIALHRFAEPNEIAHAVQFILHNGYMNGATLEIHGGYNYK